MIAGVDEAGRGPLAGPVVAAAVILCGKEIRGLADSKDTARLAIAPSWRGGSTSRCHVGIGIASVEEIDAINIFQATMLAMTRAVEALCAVIGCDPVEVLVDGNLTPAGAGPNGAGRRGRSSAAMPRRAASRPPRSSPRNIATRSCADACARHPAYGFERHKGYGTPEHLAALRTHGPTPLHRRSFAPVRAAGAFLTR